MNASDFTPIRLSTLRGKLQISFDLYVYIAEKFILYYRKGDSFEGDRLERLYKKGLKKLYILKTEEAEYKSYLRRNIDLAYAGKSGSMTERAAIIQGAQQAVVENLMESPDDKQLFDVMVESSKKYTEFILNEPAALREILQIPNRDKSCTHHGVAVASLAVAICKKMGLTDPNTLNEIVIGCFLHDIEYYYSQLPLETEYKRLPDETKAEYHKLPALGFKRLQAAGFYPDLSLEIVKGAEETIDGSGFPDGKTEDETDAMVALASACNAFDGYVGLKGMPIKEALRSILIDRMGMHPLKYFQALQDVLKDDGLI